MTDYEYFSEYFYYKDGFIYWKKTTGARSKQNTRAGKLRKDGYYDVGLNKKLYLIHRIVYCLHYKHLPKIVDHINRVRSDNRVENLREADYNENTWNSGISVNNNTGVKGVRKTYNGKYEARVAKGGVTFQVGTFSSLEEAKNAIHKIREKFHDEYSCHG